MFISVEKKHEALLPRKSMQCEGMRNGRNGQLATSKKKQLSRAEGQGRKISKSTNSSREEA